MGFGEQTEDRRLEIEEPFFVSGGVRGGVPGYWLVDRRDGRSIGRVFPDDSLGCEQAHAAAEVFNAKARCVARTKAAEARFDALLATRAMFDRSDAERERMKAPSATAFDRERESALRRRVDPQVSDWHSAAARDIE